MGPRESISIPKKSLSTKRPNQLNNYTAAIALALASAMGCGSNSEETVDNSSKDAGNPSSCANVECPPGYPSCSEGQCFNTNDNLALCVDNDDCTSKENPNCYNGVCAPATCGSTINCEGENPNCAIGGCYNAMTAIDNCGGLGNVCTTGKCIEGICSDETCDNVVCPSAKPNCANGECYDALTDTENCGKYGNKCPTTFPKCDNGKCVE